MLTADELAYIPNPIIDLYSEYEQSIINDIARRLAKLPMTTTAAWQAQRLIESGLVFKQAMSELSKITGRSENELSYLFSKAGVRAIKFDDEIYKKAGLTPMPMNLSPAMMQVLKIGIIKTNAAMINLTSTTAIDARNKFINAADLAYMQISNGSMSYQQAIRSAIKVVATQGVEVVDYASGHRDKIDVAMRRTVLTGVNQTAGMLQEHRAQEMGADLVIVSAHSGARNKGVGPKNHASWQGKIYSRSGTHGKYPDFKSVTGYGTGEGLGGWNCRHSFYPYFEGISDEAYKPKTLSHYKKQTVIYNGQEISMYEATQVQRELERTIRFWKRQAEALNSAEIEHYIESNKVRQYQSLLRDFLAQTDLERQPVREQI